MVFSSVSFLVFFLPLVLLIYYILPVPLKYKNIILLFPSLLFYAWGEPRNIILMLISIVINYAFGLLLAYGEEKKIYNFKKIILAISVLLNISFLFYFKYINFTFSIINTFLSSFNIPNFSIKSIVLPIGISFYTFQAMSYIIDVYRDKSLVQKNILNLALYISFFPQLIAGPIVRYHDIKEQLSNRTHSIGLFVEGIERFIVGLSKKILIANIMAEVADGIFSLNVESVPSYYLFIAILAYTFQIYYDFSGYSDMAIGLGKMFGFKFLENFNYPYSAGTVTEFWRRWHISLSSWFKDYLYIPLGGNRKGPLRTAINLFIVFFTTGLWHGASFNFIIWGLFHGFFLSIEKVASKYLKIKKNIFTIVLSHIYTMGVVMLLWVLFRNDIQQSLKIITKLFIPKSEVPNTNLALYLLVDTRFYIFLAFAFIFSFPWWQKINLLKIETETKPIIFNLLKYSTLIFLYIFSFMSISDNSYNPFIYFRF